MPFISSVSGALGGRIFPLLRISIPTITMNAVTTFNQEQATFSADVNPNGATTSVKFQYSTNGTTWTDYANYTGVTGGLQTINVFPTSLTSGTLYYVRAIATNSAGSATSNTVSFTTWSLKTYTKTTSGSFSVEIPSISGVAPVIYQMLLYGGGGGANYGGGGGGGYRLFSGHASSATGTQTISGFVGAGGAAGNGGTGTGTATSGGSTTLTIGSTTWTGGGGTAGEHPGQVGNPFGRGGTVGSGTNGVNLGGTNAYGYYYPVYTCTSYDKAGVCTNYSTTYQWDAGYYACGGGGGTDSAGGNATGHTTASQVGGNGGTGGGAYGLRGGNGGGGYGTQGNGSAGGFSVGSGTIVGSGGSQFSTGLDGGITFKYYGP